MLIGSTSTSTVLEVFGTGLTEVIRETGTPSSVRCRAPGCVILAKSPDLSKSVDVMQVRFKMRADIDGAAPGKMMEASGVGGRVKVEGGTCQLTLPPFELSQLAHLNPIDGIVEAFAEHSMRSQTWSLDVEEYASSDFNINKLIEEMKALNASDLHLRAGNQPFVRVDNDLSPLDMAVLTAKDMEELMLQLGGEDEVETLHTERESSFQYHAAGMGYLRCSGYIKSGAIALAIRLIPESPLPFEDLQIPTSVRDVCNKERGLFLVCGITGSGKTTTLAAMVDYINRMRKVNIITIEDPIEYVYLDRESIVSQRQVGRDTLSFANALRGSLREDPDVILVGEMRDTDTIRAGLSAAETGHLVFSTLHTTSAVDTINRMISFFGQNERDLIRQEIAYTLQGVVCQRLLKRVGGGRVPAVEVLLGGSPIVRDAILDGNLDKLYGIIEMDGDMRSFDQYAVELYQKGLVTREDAIGACANEEGFERVVSGIKSSEGRRLLK